MHGAETTHGLRNRLFRLGAGSDVGGDKQPIGAQRFGEAGSGGIGQIQNDDPGASAANSRAVAPPRPEPPPVITATESLSFIVNL